MTPFTKAERLSKGIPKRVGPKEILSLLHAPSEEEKELITSAYAFAKKAHNGQKRYSGRSYFDHPFEVARYLAALGMSADVITAGILHDVIEDTDVTSEIIKEEFGEDILSLIEGVTKLGTLHYHGVERHVESLRKLFAATAKDVRVIIIKLMDRRHNAITLFNVPEHKRKRIALETMEIYAALADRLGMGLIKRDLEDFAFPHAYSQQYRKTLQLFKQAGGENEKAFAKRHKSIKRKLAEYGVTDFRTDYRVKGLFSLFRKLKRKDWDITKIYDIWALRIITKNISDCYTILGVIHAEMQPVPLSGRLKDYIACPKPNGYRSIHTTVYTGDGGILEIQIRTEEMHHEAQFGIASHFGYKACGESENRGVSAGVAWIQQFIPGKLSFNTRENIHTLSPIGYSQADTPKWLQHMADSRRRGSPEEYLEEIQNDFFAHRIFAFTPRGDAIDLPIGATPIDFAYSIHSGLGDSVAGAKINGKMSAIDTPLKNGDRVEIEQKKSAHPTRKWLQFVKTNLAKRKIRAYLSDKRESS